MNTATPIALLMSGVGPGETQNWSRNAILTISVPVSIETSVQAPAQRKVDNERCIKKVMLISLMKILASLVHLLLEFVADSIRMSKVRIGKIIFHSI